ncbi:prepilin peptidase [Marinomonas sp. IMCC 4694]|uniref:prepilin peptidase n=1 Tax=Marinomonas sp. IMCC 4694 TaxID=2605432 RepID=UPI001652E405|nr:A24 family peptidase [Marinomonas sp. IMCC 4694]
MTVGSFSAAYTVRWPAKFDYLCSKEAHEYLSIHFEKPPPHYLSQTRSHCPCCNHRLLWIDLLPVISFTFLKGMCRYCKQHISYRYPLIECLHLACCFPLIWLYDDPYQLALLTMLVSSLITAAIIDGEHGLIPDECTVIVLMCALLLHLYVGTLNISVMGMLSGYGVIIMLRWMYFKYRKIEGIGLGDAKLVAALGAWLGLTKLAPLLLCASLGGMLYTLLLGKNNPKQLAFGPFLIVSALLVYIFLL